MAKQKREMIYQANGKTTKAEVLVVDDQLVVNIIKKDKKISKVGADAWSFVNEKFAGVKVIEALKLRFADELSVSKKTEDVFETTIKPLNSDICALLAEFSFLINAPAQINDDGYKVYEYFREGATVSIEIKSKLVPSKTKGAIVSNYGRHFLLEYLIFRLTPDESEYNLEYVTGLEQEAIAYLKKIEKDDGWFDYSMGDDDDEESAVEQIEEEVVSPESLIKEYRLEDTGDNEYVRGNVMFEIVKKTSFIIWRLNKAGDEYVEVLKTKDIEKVSVGLEKIDSDKSWNKRHK